MGTWEPGRRIDQERNGNALHPPVFTGDGRLMALGIAPDQVLLADAATGRELARLTTLQSVDPDAARLQPRRHEAGRQRPTQKTVLVWDLRRIRDQLAPLGLDWDAPPYPTPRPSRPTPLGPIPPPRPVRVVGEVLEPQARRTAERAEMNRRLAANPDDAEALIHRGWLSLTERRLPEAIADLDHLLRLRPDDPDVDWMLGQAYQDTGNLAGALGLLEPRARASARGPRHPISSAGCLPSPSASRQQAADDFDRILAADPTRDLARYHRRRR